MAGLVLALSACAPTLSRFERTLAANHSATASLSQWCAARGIKSYGELAAASNMALDMRRATHQLSQAGGP